MASPRSGSQARVEPGHNRPTAKPRTAPAAPHAPGEPMSPNIQGAWIWAPLKADWFMLRPEERVRQHYILRLHHKYGYSFDQMDQERRTKHGRSSPKADIVIWDSVAAKVEGRAPVIAVECKSDNVTIDPDDYEQGDSYARAIGEPCEFLVMTNAKETRAFRIIRGLPGGREDIEDIPRSSDLGNAKRMEAIRAATKAFTREEFRKLLFDCHCILRDNHKMEPGAAFDEISKILFIKMYVERTGDLDKFTTTYLDNYARLRRKAGDDIMHGLFDDTKDHYRADDIFGPNDDLKVSFATFRRIVQRLERFNLGATSDDIKGIAFERFLGQTFRGELGQFFTPRTIVEFMVELFEPKEGEVVCDPASGSGGFLIKYFEFLRHSLEQEVHAAKLAARQSIEGQDLSDEQKSQKIDQAFARLNTELDVANSRSRIARIARDCIFGVDAEPRAARTSKMNMIMHGDGHGGIHHHDGFVDINGIFPGRFDLVLTNPPFGSTVGDDQKVGGTAETRVTASRDVVAQYAKRFGRAYKASHDRMLQAEKNRDSILSLYELGRGEKKVKSELLFVERCLSLLKPGGRLGIVVPDGMLNNPSLDYFREYVEDRARLLAVVSIPDKTFRAAKTSVKASLLFLQKLTEKERRDRGQTFEAALIRQQHRNNSQKHALVAALDMKPAEYRLNAAAVKSGKKATRAFEAPFRLLQQLNADNDLKAAKSTARKELTALENGERSEAHATVRKTHDHYVFMAVAEHVGIRGSGKADPINDLPGILNAYRTFVLEQEAVTNDVRQPVFRIQWSELDRWDPLSFRPIEWRCEPGLLAPLGSALKQRVERVNRDNWEFSDLVPITIHFDGSIEPRDTSDSDDYTMELFFARSGDVVLSKIDLKNGAVGLVPSSLKNVVVTNHFVVYEPDQELLYPPYLLRLIQTSFFRDYLWRKKVGSEGRKEVKIPLFEETRIPLPRVEEQKRLVREWDRLEGIRQDVEARMAEERRRLDVALLACE